MRRAAFALALALAPGCGGSTASAVTDTPIELERPTVIPLREGVLPIIEVTLDGRDAQPFLVDSGASLTVIDLPQAEELGLFVGPYSHGTYEESTYDLEDFGLYGFLVAGEFKRSPLDYGLLGMDALGEFVFILDGPGETVRLHHRELEPFPSESDD